MYVHIYEYMCVSIYIVYVYKHLCVCTYLSNTYVYICDTNIHIFIRISVLQQLLDFFRNKRIDGTLAQEHALQVFAWGSEIGCWVVGEAQEFDRATVDGQNPALPHL